MHTPPVLPQRFHHRRMETEEGDKGSIDSFGLVRPVVDKGKGVGLEEKIN